MNPAIKCMYGNLLGSSFLCNHRIECSNHGIGLEYEFVGTENTRETLTTINYTNFRWSWKQEVKTLLRPIYTLGGKTEWI